MTTEQVERYCEVLSEFLFDAINNDVEKSNTKRRTYLHRVRIHRQGHRMELPSKVQSFFDVIGFGNHVRHDEGGEYLVHGPVAESDAPLVEVQLARGNQA